MSNYFSSAVSHIKAPALGLTWHREPDGLPVAAVELDPAEHGSHIAFDDPAVARELAAACIAAAEWIEAQTPEVTP